MKLDVQFGGVGLRSGPHGAKWRLAGKHLPDHLEVGLDLKTLMSNIFLRIKYLRIDLNSEMFSKPLFLDLFGGADLEFYLSGLPGLVKGNKIKRLLDPIRLRQRPERLRR